MLAGHHITRGLALLTLAPNGVRLRTADYTADEEAREGGVRFMTTSSQPSGPLPPFTQNREFWALMGYAAALGVFGGFAGLVFMGVIGFGGRGMSIPIRAGSAATGGGWRSPRGPVSSSGCCPVTRLPEQIPGLIADLQDGHVDPRLVPGIAVVSAVSLIGGASLGPEKALGSIGGGAGSWIAQRRKLSTEDSQLGTLSGFAGAYGGLFSSPVIVVMLILEIARPGGNGPKALVGQIVASSVSFGSTSPSRARCSWTPIRCRSPVRGLAAASGDRLGLFAALVVTLLVCSSKWRRGCSAWWSPRSSARRSVVCCSGWSAWRYR